MYVETDLDKEQLNFIMRLNSPLYLIIQKKDNKYYLDDKLCLLYFPVLIGTQFSENKGISEKLAKSISWSPNRNYSKLVNDNLSNYIFAEHSLFLIKEHFKMLLKYSRNKEMLELAKKMLVKLEQVNG